MRQGFYKENGLKILFIVVFLLGFIWMGTRRTFESNSNSVEDWLPEQYQETRDYRWFLDHFPFESFIVVSWDGCTIDDDRVELFAQKLVPSQTIDNYSLFSPSNEIKADLNLDEVPERLSEAPGILPPAEASEPSAGAPEPSVDQEPSGEPKPEEELYFRSVMTGPRLIRLLEQTYAKTKSNLSSEEVHEEVVSRLVGTLVGPDKKSTAMIITLNTGFKGGGKKMQKLIDRVKEISVECGLPDTTVVKTGSIVSRMAGAVVDVVHEIVYGRNPRTDALILGGPPTDNAALDQEGTRTLFRLAGICALISLTVAIICLRDLRLTMFVFWVAIISSGISLAMVSFTGGKCDSILLSMPALVYVLAMSGSIHMVNYYHDAIREVGLPGAIDRSVRHAFTPCFFAQLTTAIGLGSLFAGKLVPITNFGFYSAVGVLLTLLLLFTYLPALLEAFPSKKFAAKHGGRGLSDNDGLIGMFWSRFGKFIVRHHNAVAIFCFVVMIFFGWYLPKIKTSVKMMSFFSDDAEIIAHYTWLEEKLGPLVPMEVVVSFDNARLSASQYGTSDRLRLINDIGEALKADLHEEVGGVLSVAMFTPDLDAVWKPGSMAHRFASSAVSKSVNDNRASLKDYLTIEGNPSLAEIRETLQAELARTKEDYLTRRTELLAKLEEAGESAELCGPDLTALSAEEIDALPKPNAEQAAASSQSALLGELQTVGKLYQDLDRRVRLLQDQESFLNENKLTDLSSLTERVEPNKPFRTLSANQADDLLASCRLWQERKGIELWRISIRVWSLKKDIDYSVFMKAVRETVEPILRAASDELVADGVVAQSAPAPNSAASEVAGGSEAQGSVASDDVRANDIIYPAGISAKYTGMVPLVYKTQHALILGLTNSLVMAFFLIAFVFMVILRNVPGGLVAMLPNIFPVVVVFGFMAWAGILVDVGTMMTASVALGVAVDDTMHYLTWFSEGVNRGETPQNAAIWAYKRCATAMTQSTMIAGIGLSAFMFSTFVPTQRFGVLMLSILFVALFGDMIFLPALLVGPVGRFFLRRRKKGKSEVTEVVSQN